MSSSAYIISCSDHYGHRMQLWDTCLQSFGFSTTYLTGDFDHYTKKPYVCQVPGSVQLPVRPYQKNISVDRILSHRDFARKALKHLERSRPKVIVSLLPPNFLAHYLAIYKKRHPETVLIFDIFDLWPETFPSGGIKKLFAPAFSIWAKLRDRNLPVADYVTTECDLFREMLRLPDQKSQTVYFWSQPAPVASHPDLQEDTISLCYLGFINNVISIEDICGLIHKLSQCKPVKLHIIGAGERTEAFIQGAQNAGAEVCYHGALYDPAKKQSIMDTCHFGLNIMKSSVCVGLTMKSVDYFRHSLPIINTIPGDTAQLIRTRGIGVQLTENCHTQIASLSTQELLDMRRNVQQTFDEIFSYDKAEEKITAILTKLLQ